MITLDLFCQIWIGLCGCSAIWFVSRREKWSRWGYILGFLSQPAWIYTTVANEQYMITLLSFWYAYSWAQGIYNFWIRKDDHEV